MFWGEKMIKAGVVGASGFAGSTLLKLLLKHQKVEVEAATSTSLAGKKVAEEISGIDCGLEFEKPDFEKLNELDVVFLAVPHGKAKPIAEKLECKVVDLSADHRLSNTYGIPEIYREQIKGAKLVANPGCYATACILAAFPLKGLVEDAVFDGISGYSGGGKTPKYDFEENIIAYRLTGHFHTREMEQQFGFDFSFSPHVASAFRGLMCTAHLKLKEEVGAESVKEKFGKFYEGSFTKVVEGIPCTKDVLETPYCHIGGFEVEKSGKGIVIVSVIDNLLKGAASQAVENMNLMFGLKHCKGLEAKN